MYTLWNLVHLCKQSSYMLVHKKLRNKMNWTVQEFLHRLEYEVSTWDFTINIAWMRCFVVFHSRWVHNYTQWVHTKVYSNLFVNRIVISNSYFALEEWMCSLTQCYYCHRYSFIIIMILVTIIITMMVIIIIIGVTTLLTQSIIWSLCYLPFLPS